MIPERSGNMAIKLPLVYGYYSIDVGKSVDPEFTGGVYKVVNMDTGVVEAETSSLPRAIMSTQSANLALTQLLDDVSPSLEELLALEMELDRGDNGQTH